MRLHTRHAKPGHDVLLSCVQCGSRELHVKIEHHHGCHNDGETENADLCQECAIKLLTHALMEVKKGVRATIGTQSIYEETWAKE